jgi:CRISPR-associated protein Csb1
VDIFHRAAQYNPAIDYVAEGELEESADKAENDRRSQKGFRHAPAVWRDDSRKEPVLGGVVARGPIERIVTVNLVALRKLDGENVQSLRRYILGLALVAATEPLDGFLRQGCLLVSDEKAPAEWVAVARDGVRTSVGLPTPVVLDYAKAAANKFGVGPDRRVAFKKEFAQADLEQDKKKGKKTKDAA